MVIQFDITKMKKKGEKLSPKNCYAKTLGYTICILTAMGVYFSLSNSTWSNDNKYMLLIKPRQRVGSASSSYTDFIKNWLTIFCDHIDNIIRPNHMNAYSNRKGVATYDSSGTTEPPPLSSIFRRGEWTLGVVLYIHILEFFRSCQSLPWLYFRCIRSMQCIFWCPPYSL